LQGETETISFRAENEYQRGTAVSMESFEFNKIAGAVLATGLLVLGLKNFGSELFKTEAPEKPGFAIAVAETQPADGGAAAAAPLPVLLAKADVGKGTAGAKACAACHSFEKGGANKVGPALWNIIGRKKGSVEGYAYSDAFKALGDAPWDFETMSKWLAAPKAMVPGTKMAFGGIRNDQTRADVIAYLNSLSDAPQPLPKP
jgi:cytochrome c